MDTDVAGNPSGPYLKLPTAFVKSAEMSEYEIFFSETVKKKKVLFRNNDVRIHGENRLIENCRRNKFTQSCVKCVYIIILRVKRRRRRKKSIKKF